MMERGEERLADSRWTHSVLYSVYFPYSPVLSVSPLSPPGHWKLVRGLEGGYNTHLTLSSQSFRNIPLFMQIFCPGPGLSL